MKCPLYSEPEAFVVAVVYSYPYNVQNGLKGTILRRTQFCNKIIIFMFFLMIFYIFTVLVFHPNVA